MIIDQDKNRVFRNNVKSGSKFSISANPVIFDILQSKLYSDPIRAITREVSANARDANKEVGNSDKDVVIILPDFQYPSFRIKDKGPGISPDRMLNVFVMYGESTKRDSNDQIGGFGLGAKVPFSYSDTFNVVTCVDGIKYTWCAYKDETGCGSMDLLSEERTSEANGTEISVPVKRQDFDTFKKNVLEAVKFWVEKPQIYVGSLKNNLWATISEWQPIYVKKTNDWALIKNNDSSSDIFAIIGGYSYRVDPKALRDNSISEAIINLVQSPGRSLCFTFEVGELTLSANRESVYLDDKTKQAIHKRCEILSKEYAENIQKDIDALPDLKSALKGYDTIVENYCPGYKYNTRAFKRFTYGPEKIDIEALQRKINNVYYNYHELKTRQDTKTGKVSEFTKAKENNNFNDKVRNSSFNPVILFQDFLGHYKRNFLIKFLKTHGLTGVVVVKPKRDINTQTKITQEDIDKLKEDLHLDKLFPKVEMLSDHTVSYDYVAPTKKATDKTIVFKYDRGSGKFSQITQQELKDSTNRDKIVYCPLTQEQIPDDNNVFGKANIRFDYIPRVCKDYTFVGSKNNPSSDLFKDLKSLDDLIPEIELLKDKAIEFEKIKFFREQIIANNDLIDKNVIEFVIAVGRENIKFTTPLIESIRNMAVTYNKENKDAVEHYLYFNLFPDELHTIAKIYDRSDIEEFTERYPLVVKCIRWAIVDKDTTKHCIEYIKMIDEKLEKEKEVKNNEQY